MRGRPAPVIDDCVDRVTRVAAIRTMAVDRLYAVIPDFALATAVSISWYDDETTASLFALR